MLKIKSNHKYKIIKVYNNNTYNSNTNNNKTSTW